MGEELYMRTERKTREIKEKFEVRELYKLVLENHDFREKAISAIKNEINKRGSDAVRSTEKALLRQAH